MKAITLMSPWAWAIIHAGKDVENRTWTTGHRGTIWVHAGLREDETAQATPAILSAMAKASAHFLRHMDLRGYVLGTVQIARVHHANDCRKPDGTLCSPWALPDMHHWELVNPVPFACPFPERGKQGLWEAPVNQ